MHPMYPTLAEMVTVVTTADRHTARTPVDPAEMDRYTHRILGQTQRSRPALIEALPELSLREIFALLELRRRLKRERIASRQDEDVEHELAMVR